MVEAVDTAPLRAHVRLLGDMLGKIIRENAGEALFERVEQIRLSSKAAQDSDTWETLDQLLASLEEQEFLIIARAFSQFLNLANIADQQHTHVGSYGGAFLSQRHPSEHTPGAADESERYRYSGRY